MAKTKIDPELLISLIENRPLIWDKSLKNYKNKKMRTAAWREVCIVLNEDFERMKEKERQNYAKNVVKKWNQIRDSWSRSLSANKNIKKSGSALVYVKKYRYHNQLLFLKNILAPSESSDSANNTEIYEDNIDIENGELENYINHSGEIKHEPSDVNESPIPANPTSRAGQRQENPTSGAINFQKSDVARQKLNVVDQKIMSDLDYQMITQNNLQNEDRHLSFFKSLLPSVALLNDDQILQFHAGVISLLQNIKSHNRNQCPNQQQSSSNYSYQSPHMYSIPRYDQPSPSATSYQSSSEIDHFQASPIGLVIKSERVDCDHL